MPKRVGFLYQQMCDKELIKTAIIEGSRGKKKRWDVKKVLSDIDEYVDKVYELLITNSYRPTVPKRKVIHDSCSNKERIIKIVPFYPDGIFHQLIVMVMKPVLMRGMYRWSCSSIPKRGNLCALNYIKRAFRNDRHGTKYCFKADVHHFYESINVRVLMRLLRRKIKDEKFLMLVESVLRSDPDSGISIGFYTNQWLANFYLEGFDRFVRSLPGVKYYVRNMDDIVILGPNKKLLHRAVGAIRMYLKSNLKLTLKSSWQIFPTKKRAIDFIGYKIWPDHVALRRKNFLRLIRQCRRAEKALRTRFGIPYKMAAGLLSRIGQLKHCDGQFVKEKYVYRIREWLLKMPVRRYSQTVLLS